MINAHTQTHTVYGPGFEAMLNWVFVSEDSVQVFIHLRLQQGKEVELTHYIELIPRHPKRVVFDGMWIGLSLVQQRQHMELYVSVPRQSGPLHCERLPSHSQALEKPRPTSSVAIRLTR